jgi:hypothetical protein
VRIKEGELERYLAEERGELMLWFIFGLQNGTSQHWTQV